MFLRECSCGISLVFTVNPLLSPPPPLEGAYLFQAHLRRLTRDGAYLRGGLI